MINGKWYLTLYITSTTYNCRLKSFSHVVVDEDTSEKYIIHVFEDSIYCESEKSAISI